MSNYLDNFYKDGEFSTIGKIICGSLVCGGITWYLIRRNLKKVNKTEYPNDIVILHQPARGSHTPNLSPFCVKLETYLRAAKIPYQNVFSLEPSPKGKFPWIEYNGKAVGDSEMCIEFLNKTKGIDLNRHLSTADKAVARAFQKLVDENTYWPLLIMRWSSPNALNMIGKILGISKWHVWYYQRLLKNQAYCQGIGRHSEEEVYNILFGDLKALSNFLEKKPYLFGDEPSETDCAVFGMLMMAYFESFGNRSEEAIKEFPNLCEYCERMKRTFWPDWDDCITHGCTREATK